MLGAGSLKEINEATGYTRILLGLRLANGKVITLARAPRGHKIDVYNEDLRLLTVQRPDATLGTVHNARSEGNISRYLLKTVSRQGSRIRTRPCGPRTASNLRDHRKARRLVRTTFGARNRTTATGTWSQAFELTIDGVEVVLRIGAHGRDFAKDELAARFAAPNLPVPPVLARGVVDNWQHAIFLRRPPAAAGCSEPVQACRGILEPCPIRAACSSA